MAKQKKGRHPFRFLFKLLLFAGLVTAIARFAGARTKDFYGMTESEAKSKLESTLTPRIGEEKASQVSAKVIPKLKERGIIKPDPTEQAVEDAKETVTEATDSIQEAVEEIEKTLD